MSELYKMCFQSFNRVLDRLSLLNNSVHYVYTLVVRNEIIYIMLTRLRARLTKGALLGLLRVSHCSIKYYFLQIRTHIYYILYTFRKISCSCFKRISPQRKKEKKKRRPKKGIHHTSKKIK